MKTSTKSQLLTTLFFFHIMVGINAQTGSEFWFAAPDVSYNHANNSIPLNLNITALYNAHVKISRPADSSFLPVEFNLAPQQTHLIRLDSLLTVDEIEVYARNAGDANFAQNKGFLITSNAGEITASYEYAGYNNTDIISLKSKNALGKDFWVSTQRKYKNHGYTDDFSGFVVVATSNNTVVNIDPNGNNLQFHGTTSFQVILQKGQTFAVRAAGQAPAQHIFGVRVTSNKNIAITIFDDSMQINDGGGNWDIFADQIVPVNLAGFEYIILKGNVQDLSSTTADGEAIFITTTAANTDIFIDGIFMSNIPNAGGYFSHTIQNQVSNQNLATYVRASKPVLVNHITGYSTLSAGSRELGGAVVPSIDGCTGSHSVTVTRPAAPGMIFFNNLIVRNDTVTGSPMRNQVINHFTYSINGGAPLPIDPSHFTFIMDSAFAFYDHSKAGLAAYYNNAADGDVLKIENNRMPFQLGVLQARQSPGSRYAYFSDFSENGPMAGIGGYTNAPSELLCGLNPIQLVANGGVSYKWYAPYDAGLIDLLDNNLIPAPLFTPDKFGIFYFNVVISGACFASDTLFLEIIAMKQPEANFAVSAHEGCSPFVPLLVNQSDTMTGVKQLWNFEYSDGSSYEINQDTISRDFPFELPLNHTDTIQYHKLTLIVLGMANSCPVSKTEIVAVLPGTVGANFYMSDTLKCAGNDIGIENNTYGKQEVSSYLWDFNDGTFSTDENPKKTFQNYNDSNLVYTVRLKVTGTNICLDSAKQEIIILPQITQADFNISDTAACSGFDVTLTNTTTKASHFTWYLNDTLIFSQHSDNQEWEYTLPENYSASIKYHKITLRAFSENMVCKNDTSKIVSVIPSFRTDFAMTDTLDCKNSDPEIFNSTLGGNELKQITWDFGDGTQSLDFQPLKTYLNTTDSILIYKVSLKTEENGFCSDSVTRQIIIMPNMITNPSFVINEECTPATINLMNTTSQNTDSLTWMIYSNDLFRKYTATPNEVIPFIVDSLNSLSKTFTIICISKNKYECIDSTYLGEIEVFQTPVSEFKPDQNSLYSGEEVLFENLSQFADTYNWDLGNGYFSSQLNTSAKYIVKDTTYFPVNLFAYNNHCTDSSLQTILVYPEIISTFPEITNDPDCKIYISEQNLVIDWNQKAANVVIKITDLYGRDILKQKTELQHGKNILDEIKILPDIYFVRFEYSGKQYFSKLGHWSGAGNN